MKKREVAIKMKRRSEAYPVTKQDHKLSVKHLKDSIEFNRKHMAEHLDHIKEDKKLIKAREKTEKKAS